MEILRTFKPPFSSTAYYPLLLLTRAWFRTVLSQVAAEPQLVEDFLRLEKLVLHGTDQAWFRLD